MLIVALFYVLTMVAMMWMMMGGMSAFRGGRTDSHDTKLDAMARDGKS